MAIDDETIEAFQRDGVVRLPGLFRDWVEPLRAGVAAVMATPSWRERSYRPTDGSAPFFQDYCNWARIEPFRRFLFASPAAAAAARLMRSPVVRFFHDHVLVKNPGNSTVTPWHQDAPYYLVGGEQTISFWTPLDPVGRDVALECVAGSHRWSAAGYRPRRFDGTPLYAEDSFDDVPDIDGRRDELRVLGWAMEPGDAVAFDFRTIHGAPANHTDVPRRVFSTRWVGADARFVARSGPASPPFPDLTIRDGAPFEGTDFPLVLGG